MFYQLIVMKKKIFFLLSSMNVGGVEKAFLSMLPYISEDKYEIHLGLLSCKGGFLNDIPKYVKVHHICFPFLILLNNFPKSASSNSDSFPLRSLAG